MSVWKEIGSVILQIAAVLLIIALLLTLTWRFILGFFVGMILMVYIYEKKQQMLDNAMETVEGVIKDPSQLRRK